MWPKIRPNGPPPGSRPRRVRSPPTRPRTRRSCRSGRRPCWPPVPRACRSPTRHARPLSRPCRRSGPMVPTTGASGSSSGRTCAPSTGPPSSPACAPPSAQSPPPAANATNPPLSKGPGRRALFYLDDDAIDLAVAAQDVDGAESLQVQLLEAAAQLIMLPPDDGGANRPPARRVPRQVEVERQVEGNRDWASVLSGFPDELSASHPFGIGRVDHGQGARREPGVEPPVKPAEGGIGRVLV